MHLRNNESYQVAAAEAARIALSSARSWRRRMPTATRRWN